jgi:hypothetical protein
MPEFVFSIDADLISVCMFLFFEITDTRRFFAHSSAMYRRPILLRV